MDLFSAVSKKKKKDSLSDVMEMLGKTTEKSNTCKCNACQLNEDTCYR